MIQSWEFFWEILVEKKIWRHSPWFRTSWSIEIKSSQKVLLVIMEPRAVNGCGSIVLHTELLEILLGEGDSMKNESSSFLFFFQRPCWKWISILHVRLLIIGPHPSDLVHLLFVFLVFMTSIFLASMADCCESVLGNSSVTCRESIALSAFILSEQFISLLMFDVWSSRIVPSNRLPWKQVTE